MDRRRVLLLAALVLGASALVASLSAPRDEGDSGDDPQTEARPVEPPAPTRELALNATEPATHRVRRGTHVILRVEVSDAGEVSVPTLGLFGNATPGTPAVFDILAERAGVYEVTFAPTGGDPRRAGDLVVGP